MVANMNSIDPVCGDNSSLRYIQEHPFRSLVFSAVTVMDLCSRSITNISRSKLLSVSQAVFISLLDACQNLSKLKMSFPYFAIKIFTPCSLQRKFTTTILVKPSFVAMLKTWINADSRMLKLMFKSFIENFVYAFHNLAY